MVPILNPKYMYIFFSFFLIFKYVDCLIIKNEIISNKDWVLLGKFCFISEFSRFTFQLTYPESNLPQNLLLYFDNQWVNAYPKPSMTCRQKEYELTRSQIINLTTTYPGVDCVIEKNSLNENILNCSSKRVFISVRPRYWFVVVSRCESNGIRLNYQMEFTNGNDSFRKHFSADEFGIFEASIAMTIIYFLMSSICIFFAKILIDRFFLHITIKLYILSVFFQFFSFLFIMIEYAQMSTTGLMTTGLITTSHVFEAIGQIVFLMMLILVSKGLTITRNRLRPITWIKIAIFFGVYILAFLIAFIYFEALFDNGLVNYYYNSPGAIAVLVIKMVLGWSWFVYSIAFTIKNFPEKRIFYIILLCIFSIWFLIGPILIFICNFVIADHIRQFVGFIIQSTIITLGHLFFLILVRPTSDNKLFPYHVKTNQIVSADNQKGDYPHHDETKGGNTNLNDVTTSISSLFMVKNNGDKYQVSSVAPIEESNEI